jgi:hypothetical protein
VESLGDGLSRAEALAVVEKMVAYDLGEAGDAAERMALLTKESRYQRWFFITDRPRAADAGSSFRVITVGRPMGNLALTAFRVGRPFLTSAHLEGEVAVTNFSSAKRTVKILLRSPHRLLGSEVRTVDPRRSVTVWFKGFPEAPYYEAQIEENDGLAVDNRRFAVLPASGLSILAVTPRPQSLRTLGTVPGVSLQTVAPTAYLPQEPRDAARRLLIFQYAASMSLPRSHAVFILPPRENPLVRPGEPAAPPVVTGWREPHPLTRYINFALFRPSYARVLRPRLAAQAVVEVSEGPLVLAFEHQGFRYLVLGFDPFPYLGRENLPVSIFTLNLLGWFQEAMRAPDLSTGEPLKPALLQGGGAVVVSPQGERSELTADSPVFTRTFFQGIYRIQAGRSESALAINFNDSKESDLAHPTPVTPPTPPAEPGPSNLAIPLWAPFLVLGFFLLLLDWFFHARARRARSVTATTVSVSR